VYCNVKCSILHITGGVMVSEELILVSKECPIWGCVGVKCSPLYYIGLSFSLVITCSYSCYCSLSTSFPFDTFSTSNLLSL
jgi:hypothetical protein